MAEGMNPSRTTPQRRHGWLLAGLTAASILLHFWVTDQVGRSLPTPEDGSESKIKRMEAAYVKEVTLSAPPVGLTRPVAPPAQTGYTGKAKKRKVAQPQNKASEAEDKPQKFAEAASAASAPEVAASEPVKVAAAPASAPSTPAKGPTFEWPKATKVSFSVEGYFRGPITGSAAVEWLRQDTKYQVHVDARIGGGLGSGHVTSEGIITPDGLYPTRSESAARLAFKDTPVRTVVLDKEEITFNNGDKAPRPADVQDMVSIIAQLSYRFTLEPSLLKPGSSIPVKIATTKKLEEVTLDVVKEEVIESPMGPLNTFHVKPRRTVDTGGPIPLVEIWFAPNLQYLPVRMYGEQPDGFRGNRTLDMRMERPPQQVGAQD